MYVNFVLIILYSETIPNDFMGESCVHIYAVRKSGEMFKIERHVQYLFGFAFGAFNFGVFTVQHSIRVFVQMGTKNDTSNCNRILHNILFI